MVAFTFKVNQYSRLDVALKWRLTENSINFIMPLSHRAANIFGHWKSLGKIFSFSEDNVPVVGYMMTEKIKIGIELFTCS